MKNSKRIVLVLSILTAFLMLFSVASYAAGGDTNIQVKVDKTEYNLIFKQGFSANTLHRIKKGEAISTKTLDALCYALDCEVENIIKFEKEQHLIV